MLKDINEKKACRFAAELLLPEEALAREIQDYCLGMEISNVSLMSFYQFSTIIIYLTVKYQLPLKAVIYRLAEEHYIENVDRYIKDYGFIKSYNPSIVSSPQEPYCRKLFWRLFPQYGINAVSIVSKKLTHNPFFRLCNLILTNIN